MKTLFIIILSSILFSFSAYNQEDTVEYKQKYRNAFKISPLYLYNSTFQFGIEIAATKKDGIVLFFWAPYRDRDNEIWEGYGLEFQFRHYFHNKGSKSVFNRLYFSPFLSFKYSEITEDNSSEQKPDIEYKFNNFNGGVIFGYNVIISQSFNLDFYFGGCIRKTFDDYNTRDDILQPGYNGIAPKIGFDLGFNI